MRRSSCRGALASLTLTVVVVVLQSSGAAPALAADRDTPVWLGADGEPLPFTTADEIESFLREAEIVSMKDIGTGITVPKKLLLERDGVRAHAAFKDVNKVSRGKTDLDGYIVIDLRDYHLFDCAAYQLDRLLGLDRVPPAVPRKVDGRSGTVSLWIEHAIVESKRRERGLEPPDPARWERQKQIMYVFDNLIGNTDRNLGNILIDRSWRLWFIDHTRAFVTSRALPEPKAITSCERHLFQALEQLQEADVRGALAPYLNEREIRALLVRRTAILDSLHKQIAARGEDAVLFDLAPPGPEVGDW